MGEYKLVASDLDGMQFAISTGRTYGEILPALRADPNIRYVIHSDGAVICSNEEHAAAYVLEHYLT